MAESTNFVRNARTLEKLKTSGSFPDSAYEQGKYILFIKSEMVCLSGNKLLWRDLEGIPKLDKKDEKPITVILDVVSDECFREVCLFAVDFDVEGEAERKEIETKVNGKFVNGRSALFILNEHEARYVSQARALINFNRTTKYCNFCSGELINKSAGSQKECKKCNRTHYPNTCPVGITLIENSTHNKVLLVRQSRHPKGMYSCVAGFIEAGESLDQNIRREVAEEVGLEVDHIEFCGSQPWAMPSSQLMLGCITTAQTEDFQIDELELQDAQWVDADKLREAIERVKLTKDMRALDEKKLWVPPPTAIAHTLMETWLKKYHN